MRKVDVPLRHMTNIIATCNVLYNIYTISKDKFDKKKWIEKAERELQNKLENMLVWERQKMKAKMTIIYEIKDIITNKK